ncbi:MAG: NUDIX domain-containing protein [Nanoarchaeota archaeon]|nr:NUDIX domain-containing protein [Nanoarchaeota archaeon]
MKQTISAGGIVLNSKGSVLVVSQHNLSWSLPKGHVEKGENFLDAAQREIYEESGISKLMLVKELGSYKRHKIDLVGGDDPSELKTIHLFLFRTRQNKLAPLDSDNPEARWVEKEKVAELLTHKKDKEFFRKVLDEL